MEKSVIVDFPDDFKFPKLWGYKDCERCPFDASMDDSPLCFLTGDCGSEKRYNVETGHYEPYDRPKCPFYGGANTAKMLY